MFMAHRLLRVLADLLLAGLVYVRIAPQVLSLRWIEQSRNSGPTRSARAHADKPVIAMSVGSPRSVLANEGPYINVIGLSYNVAPDTQRFFLLKRPNQPPATRIHVVANWFDELKRLAPVTE